MISPTFISRPPSSSLFSSIFASRDTSLSNYCFFKSLMELSDIFFYLSFSDSTLAMLLSKVDIFLVLEFISLVFYLILENNSTTFISISAAFVTSSSCLDVTLTRSSVLDAMAHYLSDRLVERSSTILWGLFLLEVTSDISEVKVSTLTLVESRFLLACTIFLLCPGIVFYLILQLRMNIVFPHG